MKINLSTKLLFQRRIDACDTLLDYLHDDVAWKDQQPAKGVIESLRNDFESELEKAASNE